MSSCCCQRIGPGYGSAPERSPGPSRRCTPAKPSMCSSGPSDVTTDLAEAGLERLICEALTSDPCEPPSGGTVGEPSPGYGGGGWSPGNRHDYDRKYCGDLCQLRTFLNATQPESAALCIGETVRNSIPRPWGPPPDGAGGSGGGRVGSSRRVGSGSSSGRRSGSIRCLGLLGPIKKPSPRQIAERTIVGEIRTLATGC